jgi:hypothetical protein
MPHDSFGAVLLCLRVAAGLTQEQLAARESRSAPRSESAVFHRPHQVAAERTVEQALGILPNFRDARRARYEQATEQAAKASYAPLSANVDRTRGTTEGAELVERLKRAFAGNGRSGLVYGPPPVATSTDRRWWPAFADNSTCAAELFGSAAAKRKARRCRAFLVRGGACAASSDTRARRSRRRSLRSPCSSCYRPMFQA